MKAFFTILFASLLQGCLQERQTEAPQFPRPTDKESCAQQKPTIKKIYQDSILANDYHKAITSARLCANLLGDVELLELVYNAEKIDDKRDALDPNNELSETLFKIEYFESKYKMNDHDLLTEKAKIIERLSKINRIILESKDALSESKLAALDYAKLYDTTLYNTYKNYEREWRLAIPAERQHAENKRAISPKIGESSSALSESTWGKPSSINRTTTSYGVHEQWVYHEPNGTYRFLYFDNDRLTAIQD